MQDHLRVLLSLLYLLVPAVQPSEPPIRKSELDPTEPSFASGEFQHFRPPPPNFSVSLSSNPTTQSYPCFNFENLRLTLFLRFSLLFRRRVSAEHPSSRRSQLASSALARLTTQQSCSCSPSDPKASTSASQFHPRCSSPPFFNFLSSGLASWFWLLLLSCEPLLLDLNA